MKITHLVMAVTVIAAAAVFWLAWKGNVLGFALPALLIIVSLAVFILLMVFASSQMQALGVQDAGQPFGLPRDTVRAILTLSFVVLVGVFGSYVLFESSHRAPLASVLPEAGVSVSADEAKRITDSAGSGVIVIAELPVDGKVTLRMFARPDYAAADDIAKQIVTILATLLSAMIGFYFGARSEASSDPAEALRAQAARNTVNEKIAKLETAANIETDLKVIEAAAAASTSADKKSIEAHVKSARDMASKARGAIDAARTVAESAASTSAALNGEMKKLDETMSAMAKAIEPIATDKKTLGL